MQIEHMLEMGGYGRYIWSAYGITLAVFAWNIAAIFITRRNTKKILKEYYES